MVKYQGQPSITYLRGGLVEGLLTNLQEEIANPNEAMGN